LHAGAFWYFDNEDGSGHPVMDGARSLAAIETDIMSGWTSSHYSEQEGLEISVYPWDPLTHDAFTGDWRTGQYAVVNWGAHGWTNSIARKVWASDDGDSIPEASEITWPNMLNTFSNLDDDFPATVFAMSCLVGCPETNDWGRMGVDLLTLPSWGASIGVMASARSPYGSAEWPPGGSESICYEFNKNMILGGEKVGEAFYNSKFYCNSNYGWEHYAEYINMYTYNLFGDPALTLEGIDVAGIHRQKPDADARECAGLLTGPSPALDKVNIRCYIPYPARTRLDVYDVLGRRVRTLAASDRSEGWQELIWDGRGNEGQLLSGGIYWVRLTLPDQILTTRVVRLR
jgi:hypothetical protein